MPKRPTQAQADRFYNEFGFSPVDDLLVTAFLVWGGWSEIHRGLARACLIGQHPDPGHVHR